MNTRFEESFRIRGGFYARLSYSHFWGVECGFLATVTAKYELKNTANRENRSEVYPEVLLWIDNLFERPAFCDRSLAEIGIHCRA